MLFEPAFSFYCYEGQTTHGIDLAGFPLLLQRCNFDIAQEITMLPEDPAYSEQGRVRRTEESSGSAYGMCEKSRSYARSIARAMSSDLGRENAGGSWRS